MKIDKKRMIIGLIGSFIFVLANLWAMKVSGRSFFSFLEKPAFFLLGLIIFIPVIAALFYLLAVLADKLLTDRKSPTPVKFSPKDFGKYCGLYTFVFFLSFVPAFLSFFPGIFAYDSNAEIAMVINNNISSWHTLAHMSMFKGAFELSKYIAPNLAYGLFTLLQMLILAFAFGYSFTFLKEIGTGKVIFRILFFAMLLLPMNHIFAVSWVKDVLFAALFTLAVISLLRLYRYSDCGISEYGSFVIFTALSICFRNNAKYAALLALPFLILLFWKKRPLRFILSLAAVIILFTAINFGLEKAMDAEVWTSRTEMCSLFIQQIACVYNNAADGPALVEEVFAFIPEEALKNYSPDLADQVKSQISNTAFMQNIRTFIKVWINAGIKHPFLYVDALISECKGFYSFADITHRILYGRSFCLSAFEDNIPGLKPTCLIPPVKNFYSAVFENNQYLKIPVIRLLFEPAFYVLLYYFTMLYSFEKKSKNALVSFVPVAGYYLTLLLAPVAIIRYIYCLMLLIPFLLVYNLKNPE